MQLTGLNIHILCNFKCDDTQMFTAVVSFLDSEDIFVILFCICDAVHTVTLEHYFFRTVETKSIVDFSQEADVHLSQCLFALRNKTTKK